MIVAQMVSGFRQINITFQLQSSGPNAFSGNAVPEEWSLSDFDAVSSITINDPSLLGFFTSQLTYFDDTPPYSTQPPDTPAEPPAEPEPPVVPDPPAEPPSEMEILQTVHKVTRLYEAALDREGQFTVFDGLNFWIEKALEGASFRVISEAFLRSPEFVSKYGDALDPNASNYISNAEFVDVMFQNVLGRPPAPQGREFWVNSLENGSSRGTVLSKFSESPENVANTASIIDRLFESSDGYWEIRPTPTGGQEPPTPPEPPVEPPVQMESTASFFLLDQAAEFRLQQGDPAEGRLDQIDINGFLVAVNGNTVELTFDSARLNENAVNEVNTHAAFVAALQADLLAEIDAGTLPQGTQVQLNVSSSLIEDADGLPLNRARLEDGSFSNLIPAITIISGDGSPITPLGFIRPMDIVGTFDLFGRFSSETELIG